jgi:hypothetical protein
VADLPEDLARVLAELEARKRSLKNRLQSLDSAIEGIQGRQQASKVVDPAPDPKVLDYSTLNPLVEVPMEGADVEVPERENAGEVHPSVVLQGSVESDTDECTDFVLQPNMPHTPAETPKALRIPITKPAPEQRKPAQLNVYVNQNTDWASRQLVAPNSPRAVFRHKTGHKCPKCGSADTRLSLTRGIGDCFMFLFDYTIARCRNCDSRFRIWRSRDEDDGEQERELEPHTSTK